MASVDNLRFSYDDTACALHSVITKSSPERMMAIESVVQMKFVHKIIKNNEKIFTLCK